MPGRLLLDTNAIIQLLAGNEELLKLVSSAEFVSTSVVCELEFLSFQGLGNDDAELYRLLRSRIKVFGVPENDPELLGSIIAQRFNYGLKLPDAIIAGTAVTADCVIVTADRHFDKLKDPLRVRFYTPINDDKRK